VRLGIDIDGPTANFVGACARVFGFDESAVTTWDSIFAAAGFETGFEFFQKCADHGVFGLCDPTKGAYEAIRLLAREGHKIVFVTQRPDWARDETETWLDTWFGDVDYELFFVHDKRRAKCDIYLDDSPHVLSDLTAAREHAVAFDFPWNRRIEVIHRVGGWQEFHRYVNSFPRPLTDPAELAKLTEQRGLMGEVRMTDPKTGGQKGSKPQRMDLLPYDTLMKVSEHYGYGATKYEDRNWERGYDYSLSYSALQRHAAAWWQGEELDEDGRPHLDAMVFHALALRTYDLRGIGNDNRPLTKPATQE